MIHEQYLALDPVISLSVVIHKVAGREITSFCYVDNNQKQNHYKIVKKSQVFVMLITTRNKTIMTLS